MTDCPAAAVSCALTGSSGTFDTPVPLKGSAMSDLVHGPVYLSVGSVSCQCEIVLPGWMSNASTTTTFPWAWLSCRPVTVSLSVWVPGPRSLMV